MKRIARLLPGLAALALAGGACGDGSAPDTSSFPPIVDAGEDAPSAVLPDANADSGVDPTLGAPCVEDAQCDDEVSCTFDRCDPAVGRCRHVPDDALCQDTAFCNGHEKCSITGGCQPGPPEACADKNVCTIDVCVEATKACVRKDRDMDEDGEPDARCFQIGDCDDEDPLVSHAASEVCANGKDDDCDGQIDETPCVDAKNDTCATAQEIASAGTYFLSTKGAKKDVAITCNVTPANAARDIVVAIRVPAGPSKDVVLRAESSEAEIALAIGSGCGTGEIQCTHVAPGVGRARAIGRSLAPGLYYVTLQTRGEAELSLRVDFADATAIPGNEACAGAIAVPIDTTVPIAVVDAKKDLDSACPTGTGELTYSFNLAAPADVRIFTQADVGSPIVSLRDDADCGKEDRCTAAGAPSLFARSLGAGPHVVAIAGSEAFSGSLLVQTSPPTARPADETCAAPPSLVADTGRDVVLANRESLVQSPCAPGFASAVYALDLAVTSDVLLVGRFSTQDAGTVALLDASCALTAQTGACGFGNTPVRVRKRGVPPGSYRVVVGSRLGTPALLRAFVRPSVPPVSVATGDSCADLFDLGQGGYFVGDTALATANFDATCDSVASGPGGAKDQILKLVLASRRRVVLDMGGSGYSTLLNLRTGLSCPGNEVSGACYVGFTESRSFLELVLDPATYFVTVDGYGSEAGPWNLDVRVVPP